MICQSKTFQKKDFIIFFISFDNFIWFDSLKKMKLLDYFFYTLEKHLRNVLK